MILNAQVEAKVKLLNQIRSVHYQLISNFSPTLPLPILSTLNSSSVNIKLFRKVITKGIQSPYYQQGGKFVFDNVLVSESSTRLEFFSSGLGNEGSRVEGTSKLPDGVYSITTCGLIIEVSKIFVIADK